MTARTVNVRIPSIAEAVKTPLGPDFAPCLLNNRGALRWAALDNGLSLVLGVSVAAILLWVLRGWYPLAPFVFIAIGILLFLFVLSVNAPLSVEISPAQLTVRRIHQSRSFRMEGITTIIFTLSAKEAGRTDHERRFNTRVRKTSGKERFVGDLQEAVVVELAKRLPHSKMIFRVVSARGMVDLRPKETV